MIFYYLLLGHLLGDFTFQTNRIAANKNTDTRWIILHTFIVTLSIILLTYHFGYIAILFALLNGLLHFGIDYYKAAIILKKPFYQFLAFLVDQLLHISILYGISLIPIKYDTSHLPLSKEQVFLLIAVVFTISFSSIIVQFLLKLLFSNQHPNFFMYNERLIGNIVRITTFIFLYASIIFSETFIITFILLLSSITYYYISKWRKWMSIQYFIVKLTLDFSFSFIGFVVFFKGLS